MDNFIPEIWSGKTIELFYLKLGKYFKENQLVINTDYRGWINRRGAEVKFEDGTNLVVDELISADIWFSEKDLPKLAAFQCDIKFMSTATDGIAEKLFSQLLEKDDLRSINYFACMVTNKLEKNVLTTYLWYGFI